MNEHMKQAQKDLDIIKPLLSLGYIISEKDK